MNTALYVKAYIAFETFWNSNDPGTMNMYDANIYDAETEGDQGGSV